MTSIYGYAAIYNNIDSDHDVILKGAVSNLHEQFYLFWQHDLKQKIGNIEAIREDDRGLFIKANIWNNHPDAKQINSLIRNHIVTGLSIGFKPLRTKIIKSKRMRLINLLHLYEISVVTNPANILSQIQILSN